jgi:hypothetical protein
MMTGPRRASRKGRPALSIPGKTSAAAREAFPTEAHDGDDRNADQWSTRRCPRR